MQSPKENNNKMAVLFDLDGTLLDTAPDFHTAINRQLAAYGKPPLPFERIRPLVSLGSLRVVQEAFSETTSSEAIEALRKDFLLLYRETNFLDTKPFPGIEQVLTSLEEANILWGIVTNKPERLTLPLVKRLGYDKRAACIISGDTISKAKPHPEPLLHACQLMNVTPEACLYIGDAERDMVAGKAAGMKTLAALFGYIPQQEDIQKWPFDDTVDTPEEILPWIKQCLNLTN